MQLKESVVPGIKEFIDNNYNLRYNVITRTVERDGVPVNDLDLNSIFIAVKTNCNNATKDLVLSLIYSDSTKQYNPFLEFFTDNINETLGTENLDNLIASIDTDTPGYDMFIRKWLVSLIASIHGKHSPLMLILCGGQNTGKTEWFRRLLPTVLLPYYAESKLDGDKDSDILMTKKIIILDDEFGGKNKQESKKLKEMTSKQTFSIREPYGRVSVDLMRLAMLCGTTNDLQVLNDPTGNRRMLPIHVLGINHDLYNSINKSELFMELYNLYCSGYNYHLTKDEIKLLNQSTGEFQASCMEEELVCKYYALPDESSTQVSEVTSADIISHIKQWSSILLSPTKLGLVLKKLGFEQRIVRKGNNSTQRIYRVVKLNP